MTKHMVSNAPSSAPRALIGPTGYGSALLTDGRRGSFGIVWRNAPALESRGGYSGPFESQQLAEERAVDLALHYEGELPSITRVENVNRICRQCEGNMPEGCTVTCGRSECQQKEAGDNMARAYIKGLRSKAKRAYAARYWEWLNTPPADENGPAAEDLSYMAAQAVRLQLMRIKEGV